MMVFLRLKMPPDCRMVVFSDDLMLIAIDKKVEGVAKKAKNMINRVNSWIIENELSLAPEKTEIIALTGQKRRGI